MSDVILSIADVFQLEGRGTTVVGVVGDAADSARPGMEIELRTPSGDCIRTSIKFFETAFPCFSSNDRPVGAIVLTDEIASDRIPAGSEVVARLDDIDGA